MQKQFSWGLREKPLIFLNPKNFSGYEKSLPNYSVGFVFGIGLDRRGNDGVDLTLERIESIAEGGN